MGQYTVWKAKPTRRVYIPKSGKPGQERPLGIPTLRNRVAQAIVKNALEPCWEAQFEPFSYGFRPGRSVHDAIEQSWTLLNGRTRRPWILDADLKSAFDKISHDHILERVGPVPGRHLIKGWLKAGYVEADFFHTTDSGTPQGGIVSPLLLNVALHGLHQALGPAYGYVRYADDFIVCARSREQIEAAQSTIEEWLKPRGLTLHPEKTRIVHIKDGFNFLSFSIRHYKGKCLVKPQKEKVLSKLAELRLWLNQHKAVKAESVIRHFNQILPGWTNHYRHAVSKEVFAYVSHKIWKMLWKWCKRRHPRKSTIWIRKKYFRSHDNVKWTFHAKRGDKTIYLFDVGSVRIQRHIKVRGTACPDDASLQDYWQAREIRSKIRPRRSEVKTALSKAKPGTRAV